MSDEHKALVALLAKSLLPEAQGELSEAEAAVITKTPVVLSEADKQMLENFNPLAFLNKTLPAECTAINFPNMLDELPHAVGFYRKSMTDASDKAVNEAISQKRKEIVDSRRREQNRQDDKGNQV